MRSMSGMVVVARLLPGPSASKEMSTSGVRPDLSVLLERLKATNSPYNYRIPPARIVDLDYFQSGLGPASTQPRSKQNIRFYCFFIFNFSCPWNPNREPDPQSNSSYVLRPVRKKNFLRPEFTTGIIKMKFKSVNLQKFKLECDKASCFADLLLLVGVRVLSSAPVSVCRLSPRRLRFFRCCSGCSDLGAGKLTSTGN
jgi:hypothetical protein